MSPVKVVTDSAAELSEEAIEAFDITVVPWRVQIGTETLVDGPDLRTPEFYQEMAKKRRTPVLLPPTARQFAEAYRRLAEETDQIVSIHGAAELSQALQAARQGRLELMGRCDIQVVDSQFLSKALGLLVMVGADVAQAGGTLGDVVRAVNGAISRTYLAFYTDALDNLFRTGLLRDSRERIGITPTYKPIMLLEEGQIVPLQRSRRRGEPVERLVEFIAEFNLVKELYLLHTGLSPYYEPLKEQLALMLPQMHFEEHIYGPLLSSLIGPTALGVVALEY